MLRALRHSPEEPSEAERRLDIRSPVRAAGATLGLLVMLAGAAAFGIEVETGLVARGELAAGDAHKVTHPKGGTIARVQVADGQTVSAGDPLVSFDTQSLAEEIGALKSQVEAAGKAIELARLEVVTLGSLEQRGRADENEVKALRRRAAEAERELKFLTTRLDAAEADIENSVVRAPVSGQVSLAGAARPGLDVAPRALLLEITPPATTLTVEASLEAVKVKSLRTGMPADVWLGDRQFGPTRAVRGRLAWISTELTTASGSEAVVRVEIECNEVERLWGAAVATGRAVQIRFLTGRARLATEVARPVRDALAMTFQN